MFNLGVLLNGVSIFRLQKSRVGLSLEVLIPPSFDRPNPGITAQAAATLPDGKILSVGGVAIVLSLVHTEKLRLEFGSDNSRKLYFLSQPTRQCWIIDPRDGYDQFPVPDLPSPRFASAVATIPSGILVIGGNEHWRRMLAIAHV